jgi:hypothetical protein
MSDPFSGASGTYSNNDPSPSSGWSGLPDSEGSGGSAPPSFGSAKSWSSVSQLYPSSAGSPPPSTPSFSSYSQLYPPGSQMLDSDSGSAPPSDSTGSAMSGSEPNEDE